MKVALLVIFIFLISASQIKAQTVSEVSYFCDPENQTDDCHHL